MKNNFIISGTKKDFAAIMDRLTKEYGGKTALSEVIAKEIEKYGEKGAVLN